MDFFDFSKEEILREFRNCDSAEYEIYCVDDCWFECHIAFNPYAPYRSEIASRDIYMRCNFDDRGMSGRKVHGTIHMFKLNYESNSIEEIDAAGFRVSYHPHRYQNMIRGRSIEEALLNVYPLIAEEMGVDF